MHDGAEQLSSCTDAPDGHTAASLGILLELARECNSAGQAPLIDQLTPSLDLQPFPLRPSAKRVGVGRLIERAIVRWQSDAEVRVIECVVSVCVELKRESLRDLRVLEDRRVPDVQTWCANRIAACVCFRTKTRLHESRL